MKILKEAPVWKKKIECEGYYGCGAVLEIGEEDINIKRVYGLEGDYESRFNVNCPCCVGEIKLSSGEIPARIRLKLNASISGNSFSRSLGKRLYYEE